MEIKNFKVGLEDKCFYPRNKNKMTQEEDKDRRFGRLIQDIHHPTETPKQKSKSRAGEGNSNLLQYSRLESPWTEEPGGYSPWGHKSRTQLSD